jgi:hypothetical protein
MPPTPAGAAGRDWHTINDPRREIRLEHLRGSTDQTPRWRLSSLDGPDPPWPPDQLGPRHHGMADQAHSGGGDMVSRPSIGKVISQGRGVAT